ncbi:MAG: hypothetical protein ACJ8LM_01160 [Candidatus Udaeobacter sp.]
MDLRHAVRQFSIVLGGGVHAFHVGYDLAVGQDEEISDHVQDIADAPFYDQLFQSAKKYILEMNARRSVLDLCTSFEAFLEQYIKPKLPEDISQDTKEKFLRLYGQKLDDEVRRKIMSLSSKDDDKQPPGVGNLIKKYIQARCEPKIDRKKCVNPILAIYKYRNDAAHGRPIPESALEEVAAAIKAFEMLKGIFESNCT